MTSPHEVDFCSNLDSDLSSCNTVYSTVTIASSVTTSFDFGSLFNFDSLSTSGFFTIADRRYLGSYYIGDDPAGSFYGAIISSSDFAFYSGSFGSLATLRYKESVSSTQEITSTISFNANIVDSAPPSIPEPSSLSIFVLGIIGLLPRVLKKMT
jgi:hypothetical protein